MNLSAFAQKISGLSGKLITQATVAGNTLLVWAGAQPKAAEAMCLWLDPPWRIVKNGGFVVGSADFPWSQEDFDSEAQYKSDFERVCQLCKCVEGQVIESVFYDPQTADLELSLSSGLQFRSFATVRDEEHWHLSEYATNTQYRVSPGVVNVEALAPNQSFKADAATVVQKS